MSDQLQSHTILLVDDEPRVLKALQRIFIDDDYRVLTAESGDIGLGILARGKVHLVISDYRMPGMTGAEFLREVKEKWPDILRIMLTGMTDIHSIMEAVNEGAVYKFITKPWNDEDLRLTVGLALQQYDLVRENKRLKEINRQQQDKINKYFSVIDEDKGIVGSYLERTGVISREQLNSALGRKRSDELLCDTLVRLKLATESKITEVFGKYLQIDTIDLSGMHLDPEVVSFLPRDLCERNRLIPVKLESKKLTLAMADPSDVFKCDNIAMMTGLRVVPLVAESSHIMAQLKKTHGDHLSDINDQIEVLGDFDPAGEIDIVIDQDEEWIEIEELIKSSKVPPIVMVVNAVIAGAIRSLASDIHIESKAKHTIVRYRIDGMLYHKLNLPAEIHLAVISRIKILARMDISERRRSQDGRITVRSGNKVVDIRVSSMPTINGEKIVMRILDKSASIRPLNELGVLKDDLLIIERLTKKPQGIFISTGPTGSGKTTMLYSILSVMTDSTKNFQTIEDPVEYFLDSANQIFVKGKAGMTFSSALRSTLRQDPDVILVGEIRDLETADVSFKAALTGHVVLTTLHTNNSVASITRLIDLGVRPYLISSAIEGIIAQRLVRKICKYCRRKISPDSKLLQLLQVNGKIFPEKISAGQGCNRCNGSGYAGRTGIFELFEMDDDSRHLISEHYKEVELLKLARAGGMRTLLEDGLEKVRTGKTTLEEIMRVIGPQSKRMRQCDSCGEMIEITHQFCPFCGMYKSRCCRHCREPLEKGWQVCPSCGDKTQPRATATI